MTGMVRMSSKFTCRERQVPSEDQGVQSHPWIFRSIYGDQQAVHLHQLQMLCLKLARHAKHPDGFTFQDRVCCPATEPIRALQVSERSRQAMLRSGARQASDSVSLAPGRQGQKGLMKTKYLPYDFNSWIKARTFAIGAAEVVRWKSCGKREPAGLPLAAWSTPARSSLQKIKGRPNSIPPHSQDSEM